MYINEMGYKEKCFQTLDSVRLAMLTTTLNPARSLPLYHWAIRAPSMNCNALYKHYEHGNHKTYEKYEHVIWNAMRYWTKGKGWEILRYITSSFIWEKENMSEVKVKLCLCLTKHHAMKTNRRSGGTATSILDVGTRWMWRVSFTSQPLYLQGNNPRYPLDRRLGGPQSRSGRVLVYRYQKHKTFSC
jgi:hypothetical protein